MSKAVVTAWGIFLAPLRLRGKNRIRTFMMGNIKIKNR